MQNILNRLVKRLGKIYIPYWLCSQSACDKCTYNYTKTGMYWGYGFFRRAYQPKGTVGHYYTHKDINDCKKCKEIENESPDSRYF
jgi:hypothetical protein